MTVLETLLALDDAYEKLSRGQSYTLSAIIGPAAGNRRSLDVHPAQTDEIRQLANANASSMLDAARTPIIADLWCTAGELRSLSTGDQTRDQVSDCVRIRLFTKAYSKLVLKLYVIRDQCLTNIFIGV
jgi:hypothetical protein